MSSGCTICTIHIVQVCDPWQLNTEDIRYFECKVWRHLFVNLSYLNILKRRSKNWLSFKPFLFFRMIWLKIFPSAVSFFYHLTFPSLVSHNNYSLLAYLCLWIFPYSHTLLSSSLPTFFQCFSLLWLHYMSRLQFSPEILSFTQLDLYHDEHI